MSDSESKLTSFFINRAGRSEPTTSPETLGPRARGMGDLLSRALLRSERRVEGEEVSVKIPTEEEQMINHASSLGAAATELSRAIAEQRLSELNGQRSKETMDLSALPDIVKELAEKRASLEDGDSFPIQTRVTTSLDIENSLLDIISTGDSSLSCDFKLTKDHFNLLETKIFALLPPEAITKKDFTFKMTDGSEEPICEAYSISLDENTEILIATGKKVGRQGESLTLRAMEGYVSVRCKDKSAGVDIETSLEQAFKKLGLGAIGLKSDGQLSADQQTKDYKKHHKADIVPETAVQSLDSRKLDNGYVTTREVGAGERYINQNEFVLLHTSPVDNLAQVLKHGLLSRMERYKRGIGQKNIPATPDMESGGADSVFVGSFAKDNENLKMLMPSSGVTFVFKPSMLDRQDWYAYNSAKFGSTKPEDLAESLAPADFFASQKQENILSNEIMLRRMITVDDIDAIIVRDSEKRDLIVAMLKSNGINEVAGRPVGEMIVTTEEYKSKIN